jgi:ABC-type transporter Mla maintaining outer membrane lipid asymmetry ATPase subunit MlaF
MRITESQAIIEVKNLGTCFNGEWVHKNLNLTIMPNRIVTIIGASGCGKTTLVREILMLQPITEGEISLMGETISSYDIEDAYTKRVLSQMGMMFQQGALFSAYTVLENVMFPMLEYTDYSYQTVRELAYLKLKLTGLSELAYNKYPKEISPGMLKRVALARTLALDPKVVFLDEPTAGLDPNSAASFDELILGLQKQLQLTVIMITHDLDSIWHTSDEIVYLGDKRVLLHDSVKNAADNPKIADLYAYFNGVRGKIAKDYYSQIKVG